jgi:putative inorganic carbon (hco3(-)) transporter
LQHTRKEIWIVVAISLIFIAANTYLLYHQSYLASALPLALLVGLWIFFAPTKLFFALAFLAPLSIPLRRLVPNLTFDFWFPTEPILVFLLVMLILKSFKDRYFEKQLLGHPVFLSIIFYLGWLVIASINSEMPIVSLKYLLVRFWFIGIFFYLAFVLFFRDNRNINIFVISYIVGLAVVSVFSLVKQANYGLFDHRVAHGASTPFFIDHTSYGAALAFIIPMSMAMATNSKRRLVKYVFWAITGFFLIALLLSYSRAAWLSLIVGVGVWIIIVFRFKLRTIISTLIILAAIFFTFQDDILWRLERNTTDSSGDLTEHIQSMINIKSDASNLERINRWDAALEMFKRRPIFGWGPGTYQFQYAPFQVSYNKTIISTNFGTGGNAHSEYLGLLSEAGVIGAAGFIFIILFILITGFKLLGRDNLSASERNIAIASIVGLVTYIFHGFLNNFLDADKIAALFWGFMAIIVALEYRTRKKPDENAIMNESLAEFEP